MSNATVSVIRPEFQLKVAIVDFVSQTGIEVKAGTIFARMHYAPGCELSGQRIKGAVKLSDRIVKGHRTIEFIADPSDYRTLYKSCAKSNMAVNRMRTVELLNQCFAAPAAVRPAAGYFATLCDEAKAFAQESIAQLDAEYNNLDAISNQALADFAPISTPDTSNEIREVLESKTVKQLRHIAKVYGITLGKQNKAQLVELLGRQFTRRNINPVQLRTLPTAK